MGSGCAAKLVKDVAFGPIPAAQYSGRISCGLVTLACADSRSRLVFRPMGHGAISLYAMPTACNGGAKRLFIGEGQRKCKRQHRGTLWSGEGFHGRAISIRTIAAALRLYDSGPLQGAGGAQTAARWRCCWPGKMPSR